MEKGHKMAAADGLLTIIDSIIEQHAESQRLAIREAVRSYVAEGVLRRPPATVELQERPRKGNDLETVFDAFGGSRKSLAEWLKDSRVVVNLDQVRRRLRRGWTLREAVERPLVDATDTRVQRKPRQRKSKSKDGQNGQPAPPRYVDIELYTTRFLKYHEGTGSTLEFDLADFCRNRGLSSEQRDDIHRASVARLAALSALDDATAPTAAP
jgi:hypothetical protein